MSWILTGRARIEYDKKPGKPAVVKVSREPNAGQEAIYKSGVIHTAPGELPDCVSLPTPRGKEGVMKPINAGKLLRPGGPGGHSSSKKTTTASKRRSPPTNGPRASAAPQPLPVSQRVQQPAAPKVARMVPQAKTPTPPATLGPLSQGTQPSQSPLAAMVIAQMANNPPGQSRAYSPKPAHVASTAAAETGRSRPGSGTSARAPPPAPPAHPAASREPRYRALYEFQGQTENELNLKKDDLVVILQKENNGERRCLVVAKATAVVIFTNAPIFPGWWLAKRPESTAQGWTPSAYLQEETGPRGAPPPPPSSTGARPSSTSSSVRAPGDRASFRSSTGSGAGGSSGGGTAATRAKPAPPAPPAKRPAGRGARPTPPQPPQPPEPRDSGVSGVGGGSGSGVNGANGTVGGSGRNTPNSSANASLAGGLAEAVSFVVFFASLTHHLLLTNASILSLFICSLPRLFPSIHRLIVIHQAPKRFLSNHIHPPKHFQITNRSSPVTSPPKRNARQERNGRRRRLVKLACLLVHRT